MDATQLRNLAFLMSLGGLSSACGDDSRSPLTTGTASAGTTNTTPGTSNTTNNNTNGTGPATDSDGTGEQPTEGGMSGTETSVGPLTEGTDGTLTSVGPVTTGTTGVDTDTDTGADAPPICTTYADTIVECYPRYGDIHGELVTYCSVSFDQAEAAGGQACVDAFEAWMVCLSSLECADLKTEFDTPTICKEADDALTANCPEF